MISPEHRAYMQLHAQLWQHRPDVSIKAKALWAYLMTFMNSRSCEIWRTQENAASDLLTCPRTIRRWTQELDDAGLIDVRYGKNEADHLFCIYRPLPPLPVMRRAPVKERKPRKKCSKHGSAASEANIVPFHSPTSTGSTPSTTPKTGHSSTAESSEMSG